MRTTPTYVVWTSSVALLVAACGDVPTAAERNEGLNGGTAGVGAGATAGTNTAGTNTAGSVSTGGAGATSGTGGSTGGTGSMAGAGASDPMGGSAGTVAAGTGGAMGGSSGVGPAGSAGVGGDTASGGVAGSAGDTASGGVAGSAGDTAAGGTAGTGVDPNDPYAPRTGSFKMIVFSETLGFEHQSISAGQQMLQSIGQENGFEVTVVPDDTVFTLDLLSQYEIVFFMNTTGDIFTSAEEAAFEEWMTMHRGAFAGSHSATDTESGWQFYKQVTGQYYDQHDQVSPGTIQWESDALNFPAVRGLPSPWQRNEEWYKFNSYQDWSGQEGFKILSKVTTNGGGTRPVSYVREYNNFRAFYSSLGHDTQAFQDADVKKHFAAGILWAVRREAMVQ